MECPVAECAERATPPGSCTGTFRTPHVPRDAPFSVAHETADDDDPPPSAEQRVDRTCRLRRFRGQRVTGCDAGQSEDRLRGHSREAHSEKVAIKVARRREHDEIARRCRGVASATRRVIAPEEDVSPRAGLAGWMLRDRLHSVTRHGWLQTAAPRPALPSKTTHLAAARPHSSAIVSTRRSIHART